MAVTQRDLAHVDDLDKEMDLMIQLEMQELVVQKLK
jgi:hypothetical protein